MGSYIHFSGKVAALVEVNCESDFVARTEQFQELARDLAMQVVASRPLFVSREDVPEDLVAKEKSIYREQMVNSGKPADIVERIVDGKVDKWYAEVCLLEQPFLKNGDQTVQDLIVETIAALGENIRIGQFKRVEVGGEE